MGTYKLNTDYNFKVYSLYKGRVFAPTTITDTMVSFATKYGYDMDAFTQGYIIRSKPLTRTEWKEWEVLILTQRQII